MAMQAVQSNLLEDYHLLSYDVLDSTNEEAKRLAGGGASHGAVIWARQQTAGKGRMGRDWSSPDGGLYVSVLLRPPCALPECAQLSFVTANSVIETLKPIIPDDGDLQAKWPNDILYEGKKMGGILLESFTTMDEHNQNQQWVVVGLGVNIDSHPPEVNFPATCLRESGVEIISAKIVLSRFVYHFIHAYDDWCANGFEPARKQWMDAAFRLGHQTDVLMGDQLVQGAFQGIDDFGRLMLQTASGEPKVISAGEVLFKDGTP
jgi:BirA family biotin operon repressor/biotin-[acetyl-CoA-carboxylase] ligase